MKALSLDNLFLSRSKQILFLCLSLLFLNAYPTESYSVHTSSHMLSSGLAEEIPFFQVELFSKHYETVKIDKLDFAPIPSRTLEPEVPETSLELIVWNPAYITLNPFLIVTLSGRSPPAFILS